MKIGDIELGKLPLFLAPMEDVTYKSFRFMCRKYGADVMYTEFVSSEALVRNIKKTSAKMELFDFDRPVGIQLYGHDIDTMSAAARIAEQAGPDFIDINFGCPVKKVVRKGGGAALLQDLPKMQKMAEAIVKAVKLPVTAKTRLGWDRNNKPVVEIAKRLQDAGIVALAIHGRTRDQLYTGKADWQTIGAVKNNPGVTIPIIGNGDINSAESARKIYEQTGIDGLMIGRASIGRPWIFREVRQYLKTGETPEPVTIEEVVENVKQQLTLNIQWKDDEFRAVMMMRRHFAKYFPGLPDFRELKISLLRAETFEQANQILNRIVETYRGRIIDYNNVSLR